MKWGPALLLAFLISSPQSAFAQSVETDLAGVTAAVVELRMAGGRIALRVPVKQSNVVWAYLEPVAPGTVMNIEMPYVFPFENVAVTEGPSTLLAGNTAKSTPTGAVATIVSATRANQMVNVRLRLEAEPGPAPSLGGSYFEYENVFLFDPVARRKYAMVKDTEGLFQGQPLTVKTGGGSFTLNWGRPTLVSLTFQAPPDTVTSADLLLPRFLPAGSSDSKVR